MANEMDRQIVDFMKASKELVKGTRLIDMLGQAMRVAEDPDVTEIIFTALLAQTDYMKPSVDKLYSIRAEIAVLEMREEMDNDD